MELSSAIRFCCCAHCYYGRTERIGLSHRWRQRRRRYYDWLNRFDRADKPEKSLDEMLRRVLGSSGENVKARGRCPGQFDGVLMPRPKSPQISEESEPLVDVFEDEESIVVVTELIGIDKSNVDLRATQDKLTISVDSADRKYHREIELPARVDVGLSSSRLKNGVLEIRLKKLGQELVIR